MSKQPFRTRPGVGDDVVYETRPWWLRWLPNRLNIGWYAYANAASARNRHMVRLNEMTVKHLAELNLWAEAEAQLAGEKGDSKSSQHNHLGISAVFAMDPRAIKSMLPYVDEPTAKFKEFINMNVIKKILKQHNVAQQNKGEQNNATGGDDKKPYDLVISTLDTATPGLYDNARHVTQWKAEDHGRDNSKGTNTQKKSGGNPTREDWKRARAENPKHDDEDQGDWDKRCKRWLNS